MAQEPMLRCPYCSMRFRTRVVLDWHVWKRHRKATP